MRNGLFITYFNVFVQTAYTNTNNQGRLKARKPFRRPQPLEHPDNSFMKGILFLSMQMQDKKRSKESNLAALFALQTRFCAQNLTHG